MWKTLLVAGGALCLLAAWDATLSRREATERATSARVARLVPEDEAAEMRVAGLTVESGDNTFTYARAAGAWRCLSAYGAPAQESAVLDLVNRTLVAEGVVQSRDRSRSALYGLSDSQRILLELHGAGMLSDPERDVLHALEVGIATPGAGGCYVRPVGSDEVWAVDENLRATLAPPGLGNLPPLLDPSLTPAAWVEAAGDLVSVSAQVADPFRPGFELTRRDVERTEEEAERGLPPWEWTVAYGGESEVCEPLRVWAYVRFFAQVPYRGLLDPAEFQGEGAPRIRASLLVQGRTGEPLQIAVFDRHDLGGYPVLTSASPAAYLITQEVYDLLLPEPTQVSRITGNNPWEPWLRR